ncbi:phosphatase PAP2 family protein [Streptomyces sp. NBC_00124]|uniref:phosphatase PAP2 family protein n=1 Tax=Streptomyces sp. NBC_00124 TaxID=2975662 RepID=UPI002B1E44EE|nr:phosphatase PAP2 family protein [Streptomyces sp. NBC_00124]
MGDIRPGPPQLRPGRALAHTTGASGSGSPHRSDGRPPQTPRGARRSGPDGHPGTTPPVPGWPTSFFLFLLLGLPAVLFALITWQIVEDGPLVRLDERVSRALVHPDRASQLLADLGNVQVAVPVLVVALGYAAWRARRIGTDRWWQPSAGAALLMALVPALIIPIKELTDRPGTPVVPPATGYYPSGHTATAAVAYGAATILLIPCIPRARRALLLLCAALVLGVSYGLVRRGYHWPLDVVASWCLSTVLLTGYVLAISRSSRRTSAGTPSSRTGPS